MKILGLFLILIFIVFLAEFLLRKWLGVKKQKISETPGKNVDRWGRSIILIVALCTLPFVIMKDAEVMKWFWMFYLTVLLGFQSFVQWKYLENSKEYLITLIFLIFGLFIMYNIPYFLGLTTHK